MPMCVVSKSSRQNNEADESARFEQLHRPLFVSLLTNYLRAVACFIGSHAPFSLLLATHCWIKYIPSQPS